VTFPFVFENGDAKVSPSGVPPSDDSTSKAAASNDPTAAR